MWDQWAGRRCSGASVRRLACTGILLITGLLALGTACSNNDTDTEMTASGSGLTYHSQTGVVDGHVTIEVRDLITDSRNLVQRATLKNFSITMGGCPVASHTVSEPGGEGVETVEMTSNGGLRLSVQAQMMGACVSSRLSLHFLAEVTTQANGTETVSSSRQICLDYPVHDENGALVVGSGGEQVPGTPGAVSFVHQESRYASPFYVDTYAAHVICVGVEAGGSLDGECLHVGVMAGVKRDAGGSPLFGDNGSITVDSEENVYFSATGSAFESVEAGNLLIILPNESQTNSRYLGGWEVIGPRESVDHDGSDAQFRLPVRWAGPWELPVRFEPASVSGLVWAIGTRERWNPCESSLAIVDIASLTSGVITQGTTSFELRYDPFLAGKDIFLYGNILTASGRAGVGLRKTLPGTGLVPREYTCEGGDEGIPHRCCRSYFYLNDSDELARHIECAGLCWLEGGPSCGTVSFSRSDCNGLVDVTITVEKGKTLSFKTMESFSPEYPNFPYLQ